MTARARFCFSRRFENTRPKIAFSRSFFCFCCSRWSSPSFFVRFRSASWVYEARLWRTKCFLSPIPCEGPHPHVRDLRVLARRAVFRVRKELFARREDFGGVSRPRGVLRRGERRRFFAFSVFATRRWCSYLIASLGRFLTRCG